MKIVHMVVFVLAMVGALNWGIMGVGYFANFNGNVVNMILGSWSVVENVVYVLVGLSAVWLMIMHRKECMMCKSSGTM